MSAAIKHSPGPWHWNGNSLVSGWHGYYLMHIEEYPGLGHSAEANKRLIAAAPDLLAEAKQVMALLERHGPSIVPHLLDNDQNAGERLRAAIAKAEGRS